MIPGMTQATRDLADGNQMPLLGLGVWQVPDGPECVRAVRWALELGYRHIDTAQAYRNEASVGKALAQSGIDRDDVFITTKFNPRAADPVAAATGVPAVDQVNFNPFAFRRALLDACQRHRVVLEAYSPLGTGHLLSDPVVGTIAAQASRTPAQVLLRWCVQRGVPALSKSTHRDRIAENSRIFDFELTGEELAQLDALDRTGHTGNALERTWW